MTTKQRTAADAKQPPHEPRRVWELRRVDPHHRDIDESVVYADGADVDDDELFGPYWKDEPPESLKSVKQQKSASTKELLYRGARYMSALRAVRAVQPRESLRARDLRGQIRVMHTMLQQAMNHADRNDFDSAKQLLASACGACELISSEVRNPNRF